MMVVLVVFSCLGMQLYGSQFNDFDELPRQNFDNFVMAFLTLFQVGYSTELLSVCTHEKLTQPFSRYSPVVHGSWCCTIVCEQARIQVWAPRLF